MRQYAALWHSIVPLNLGGAPLPSPLAVFAQLRWKSLNPHAVQPAEAMTANCDDGRRGIPGGRFHSGKVVSSWTKSATQSRLQAASGAVKAAGGAAKRLP